MGAYAVCSSCDYAGLFATGFREAQLRSADHFAVSMRTAVAMIFNAQQKLCCSIQ